MGHTVGEQAGRSVKKSEKTRLLERTEEEILRDIRRNLDAKLAVTPLDTAFLLAKYDLNHDLMIQNTKLLKIATDSLYLADAELRSLREQVEQFRNVYEQENRSETVRVERVPSLPEAVPAPEAGMASVMPDQNL